MRSKVLFASALVLLVAVVLLWRSLSEVPGNASTSRSVLASPTPAISPTPLAVSGFHIVVEEGKPHRVTLDPIWPVFEEHPRAVAIPGVPTNHGLNAAGNLAKTVGPSLPVRDSARNLPGTWLAFAITDERGSYVAMRLGSVRPRSDFPAQFAIEGVRQETVAAVVVEGPVQAFTGSDSIRHFSPQAVNIRSYPGVLLRQERGPGTGAPAISTLVWREGKMYWKLSGWDPPGRTYYTADLLLEIATRHLVQWDSAAGVWVPVL